MRASGTSTAALGFMLMGRTRLMIVVPVALALILILPLFTYQRGRTPLASSLGFHSLPWAETSRYGSAT